MAAGRGVKSFGRRRHKGGGDEEEEEDDGQILIGDSQSEDSVISGAEAGADAGARDGVDTKHSREPASTNGTKKGGKSEVNTESGQQGDLTSQQMFKPSHDTEAMLQGLTISDGPQDVLDFDIAANDSKDKAKIGITNGDRQRKEHEEYKKKRDADPAFIPNRGQFFMHDTRGQHNGGPAPQRGSVAARGRSRVDGAAPSHAAGQSDRASEQVWKHDLHSTINNEPQTRMVDATQDGMSMGVRPVQTSQKSTASFSSTQMLGRVQLRVLLPGSSKPVVYSEVPAVKYVRLPDHRPPLRRDKPVRIFLPGIGPRYIFPSTERSFIFIPRQMRPNNRGLGNLQQRSIGGYGYSSRRTSMYGGSIYSGSVAPSRRSSITRDREGMFSPASYISGYQPPYRPVVRLPQNGGQFYTSSTPPMMPFSGHHTPTGHIHTYPLPQQPAFQGTPTTTVQHPRPQKAISVSGIESPAMLDMRQPSVDQQAFQGQLPSGMGYHSAHPSQGSIGYDQPQQQFAFPPGSVPVASPLSRIPENAAHANNFPLPQQMYYPPYAGTQQGYYYPPMQMPMYAYPPMQHQPYGQGQMSQQQSMAPVSDPNQGNTGMVAHESNGMVFYMPATEAATQANASEQFQPAEGFVPSYAAAGLPPTPGPDQSAFYYPGIPPVANNMTFYPAV